ncbi:holotricin-3-like [Penaeus indicus]|uniref:holotricin-3-like n=1 Tax=Penaeus indicus TaxID=29960 RepID=UPI00300D9C00
MARNVAVTSLLVALYLVAAVAGHRSYGSGGHRPLGVHGSVHSSAGIHGGSAHGVGLGGSGIHGAGSFGAGSFGAGSFNPAHFPGLVPWFRLPPQPTRIWLQQVQVLVQE